MPHLTRKFRPSTTLQRESFIDVYRDSGSSSPVTTYKVVAIVVAAIAVPFCVTSPLDSVCPMMHVLFELHRPPTPSVVLFSWSESDESQSFMTRPSSISRPSSRLLILRPTLQPLAPAPRPTWTTRRMKSSRLRVSKVLVFVHLDVDREQSQEAVMPPLRSQHGTQPLRRCATHGRRHLRRRDRNLRRWNPYHDYMFDVHIVS